ncbi:iron complex outermembrane recepter protein [Duganella sp. CF402]|uniref:TonB-dependent receptor n=1 Tax=unclassified Duganella TaxID=2636909 RepID=UPI0008ADA863|nr:MULTISPECIES: TonB-dependent receptor [unclassified Duganella]RZT04162.1 iron complex outermembrane receptor protein [Duganella sp. BK701]SEM45836.1 iron complex outermembrane recepter protein [Duganella sp. CF402]
MKKSIPLTPMAAALAVALLSMNAHAQQALETVVVSANKRVEKLESVPMAISVMSEQEIQRVNIREIEDVVAMMPSLTLNSGTTSANNAIFMRGIGTVSVGIGVESDVAVIIDDIPIATQFQAFKDLADVSRIEVLKGPQSTLFGKSAVAGAVNIVTKPISGPMVYRASTYLTNDNEWRVNASAGGQLDEHFGLRLYAGKTSMPGNFHNLTDGKDVNGSGGKTFMAKLQWNPIDSVQVDLTPRYNFQENSRGVTAVNGFFLRTGSQAAGNLVSTPIGLDGVYLNGNPQLPASVLMAGINVNDPANRNVRRDFPTGLVSSDRGVGLKVSWTLPNEATLMSITSWSKYLANDFRDQDFTDQPTIAAAGSTVPTIGNYQFGTYDIRSKTQELRYVSPDSGTFKYVAGLWLAHNEIYRHFIRGYCVAPMTCNANSPSSPTNYYTDIYNTNKSIFGQASWEFLPTWTLTAGVRFNQEISGYNYKRNFYTDQLDEASFKPGPVGVDQFKSYGNSDPATTGKVSLQKQVTPEWMVYTQVSTGYKGEAYDVTSGLKASAAFPVKPETSQSFEIGAKANLFNNRLSLAATYYNSDFFGYQQNVTYVLPNDPTIYSQLNSIPHIRTHGVEIDANALVASNLTVNAALAFTLPTIEKWANGPCYSDPTNVAVNGTKLAANGSIAGQNAACFPIAAGSTTGVQNLDHSVFPGTPKIKLNVGANYDFNIPTLPYKGFVNANVRYQSDYLTNINNDPNARNKAYSITDLGFGVRTPDDKYKLSFRVNNLFDRFYIPNANASGPSSFRNGQTSTSPQVTATSWVPPRDVFRYFSVKLDVKF